MYVNKEFTYYQLSRIGGAMLSVYTALKRKGKDWLSRNQDNVSE